MNGFGLFASGEDFDVDAYLAVTTLSFDKVLRKDETGPRRVERNCVIKHFGNGVTVPFPEQKTIATEFLLANRRELRALTCYPGVSSCYVGLHYHIDIEPNIVGFSLSASSKLMALALEAGVEITFYVTIDRSREYVWT